MDPPPPRPVAAPAPLGYLIGRQEQWTDALGGGGLLAELTHRTDTIGPTRMVDTIDVEFGIIHVSTGVLFM
ncbi:MAG: hypothetical protein ACRD08_22475, partial [Acidimicrobiales bacterium]